ncbi:MAG: 16S rRNA (guanine(966)-N(2))-methyltransferase RsmD, partial [Candidatus Eremiobacteraeota bacterium]|nr:16S rRNA (guanine(966)-N(2))-methyltransferase RsmD [Candidatus Eremiobacteraeota bacterium]
RSRRLPSVPKRGLRPTPARVKESLFAILGERVEGASVLDMYAGTGALGFEALSRGAGWVTFVESNAHAAMSLRQAAREYRVEARCEILATTAERAVGRLSQPYDLVFVDPPYAVGFPGEPLAALRERGLLGEGALVVFEHSARRSPATPGFRAVREERYGEVALAFLRESGA